MNADELDAFERLIEMPDADLLSWISGNGEPPGQDLTDLVERLRAVTLQPEDYR